MWKGKTLIPLNGADKADLVNGKVPASQLPSYVDDVVEYADVTSFPATGEAGKIYVAMDTGYTYRWAGTDYIQIGGATLSEGDGIDIVNDLISVDMSYVESNLQGFEPTITDLATIRSGAAAGATAAQPADLLTKQDVINDLTTIRSGAAAGATAVQPAELATIQGQITTLQGTSAVVYNTNAGSLGELKKADVDLILAAKPNIIKVRSGDVFVHDMSNTEFSAFTISSSGIYYHRWRNATSKWEYQQIMFDELTRRRTVADVSNLTIDEWGDLAEDILDDNNNPGFLYDGSNYGIVLSGRLEEPTPGFYSTVIELMTTKDGLSSIHKYYLGNDFEMHHDTYAMATQSYVDTAVAAKQDVISDLATIRSGAALGATAVQPSAMETALGGKQDTISDLATIRSGAAAGATALQPGAIIAIPLEKIHALFVKPVKGNIITLDGGTARYRVLKINGNIAEVLALDDIGDSVFGDGTTTTFSDGSTGQKYENSTLDTYMNSTFYNSLSSNIKAAIVQKAITQTMYQMSSAEIFGYDFAMTIITPGTRWRTRWYKRDGHVSVGNRYCYALDLDDVAEYLGAGSGNTVSGANLNDMFFEQTTAISKYVWLDSAHSDYSDSAFLVYGDIGCVYFDTYSPSHVVRPAFCIDLTNIDYTIEE